LAVSESQLRYCDSVSKSNNNIITILNKKLEAEKEIINLKIAKIDFLEWEVENQKTEIKKHKSQKIAGILAGIITTSFMTYMYIKK